MPKTRTFPSNLSRKPLDLQISEDRYALGHPYSRRRQRYLYSDSDPELEGLVNSPLAAKLLAQIKQQQEALARSPADCSYFDHTKLELDSECATVTSFDGEVKDEIPMDKNDEEALEKFMIKDGGQKLVTLSESIQLRETERMKIKTLSIKEQLEEKLKEKLNEKLTEKKSDIVLALSENNIYMCLEPVDAVTLQRFKKLAPVLRDYRSGKLPKAFKAIPRFCNWEQIVLATEPENWSAATMYEATRIFVSNLQEKMTQRFFYLILLPRIRDDIAESKKLNDYMYKALKKALFKPAAFFKGIVLPLCDAKNCTYREATIVGSVLAQFSVPMLHSCAALLSIAQRDYNGVESIFMRILLEKKYLLPYRVIVSLVKHFVSCMEDTREYPLLWHQCLLTFVQLYKDDLTGEHKEGLLKVIAVHNHKHVTPEIRKILMNKKGYERVAELLWKFN